MLQALLGPLTILALVAELQTPVPRVPWAWPIQPGIVVERFDRPEQPWSAGHRGIDLAASPGMAVAAPTGATVRFAGAVVDRGVLSLTLGNGMILTLEPVRTQLRIGDAVAAGDAIGVVDVGGHCADHCLHLGLIDHEQYVSPLPWFLPRARLLPARR